LQTIASADVNIVPLMWYLFLILWIFAEWSCAC